MSKLTFGLLLVSVMCLGSVPDSGYIGRVDTIGGSTDDLQVLGPSLVRLVLEAGTALHVAWSRSTSDSSTLPDVRPRVNRYGLASRTWSYTGPDYMESGAEVCTSRAVLGSVDAASWDVYLSVELDEEPENCPAIVRLSDSAMCRGPAGFVSPVLSAGQNGWLQVGFADQVSREQLRYSKVMTWCEWEPEYTLTRPMLPVYNIAASKTSNRVCLAWTRVEEGQRRPAFYIESTDGGATWGRIVQMSVPYAFRSDTVVSFTAHSAHPYYDQQDRLHIVVSLVPMVDSVLQFSPAAIWHWCRENDTAWSKVHRAGCDPGLLQGEMGDWCAYVGRPSLGEDDDGGLYCAWEQFDSTNVAPSGFLRAGIWLSRSVDNGRTWSDGTRITGTNGMSHRFPSICRGTLPGFDDDTVVVSYLADLEPGAFVLGEGEPSDNPVVCQFVSSNLVSSVAERPGGTAPAPMSPLLPSLCRGRVLLNGADEATLYDASGRECLRLTPGWNSTGALRPGLYFARISARCHRLVVAD